MIRLDPTHVLTISVPLHCDPAFDCNPIEEALNAIMPITKLATIGAVCDDCTVSVSDVRLLLVDAQPVPRVDADASAGGSLPAEADSQGGLL